jgi:hypothetical protein
MVRGRHQLAIGANVAYWKSLQSSNARSGGDWTFDGSATGLGLADFLTGRLQELEHGGPSGANMTQLYIGAYAQDAWRMSDRVTINAGLRWEPFFGQNLINGDIANFIPTNFSNGVRSGVYLNAPVGFVYPGDPGFPSGNSGLNKQWLNFSPRIGAAWDVTGDGRTAIRSSYSLAYDFPTGEYHLINATSPPFGNRLLIGNPPGGFDDPYGHLGGDPHPIRTSPTTVFPPNGTFGVVDPDINSPRVQSWNFTIEHQLGSVWSVSGSYLGSYSDRLWGLQALNPAVFMGTGPCTLKHAYGAAKLQRVHDRRHAGFSTDVVPGESRGGAAHRRAGSAYRCRHAGLQRAEAVDQAPRGQWPVPQRELHVGSLHGCGDADRVLPDQPGLQQA